MRKINNTNNKEVWVEKEEHIYSPNRGRNDTLGTFIKFIYFN